MTEAALTDYLATAGKSSPLVTSKIDELISRGAYLRPRFFAFGYDGATVIGNVSIDSRETEGYTLEMLLPAIEGMLGQVGATGIGSSRVRLPAGDAVRVTYSITTRVKQTRTGRRGGRSTLARCATAAYGHRQRGALTRGSRARRRDRADPRVRPTPVGAIGGMEGWGGGVPSRG